MTLKYDGILTKWIRDNVFLTTFFLCCSVVFLGGNDGFNPRMERQINQQEHCVDKKIEEVLN